MLMIASIATDDVFCFCRFGLPRADDTKLSHVSSTFSVVHRGVKPLQQICLAMNMLFEKNKLSRSNYIRCYTYVVKYWQKLTETITMNRSLARKTNDHLH
jgi:hypothetical protein